MSDLSAKVGDVNLGEDDAFEDHYLNLAFKDPKSLLPESPFEAKDFELTHREAVKYMLEIGHSEGNIVGAFVDKYGFEAGVERARDFVSE